MCCESAFRSVALARATARPECGDANAVKAVCTRSAIKSRSCLLCVFFAHRHRPPPHAAACDPPPPCAERRVACAVSRVRTAVCGPETPGRGPRVRRQLPHRAPRAEPHPASGRLCLVSSAWHTRNLTTHSVSLSAALPTHTHPTPHASAPSAPHIRVASADKITTPLSSSYHTAAVMAITPSPAHPRTRPPPALRSVSSRNPF